MAEAAFILAVLIPVVAANIWSWRRRQAMSDSERVRVDAEVEADAKIW